MIEVGEDQIHLKDETGKENGVVIATGGPEDPIELVIDRHTQLTREDLDQFQRALVNFMNTGYFDVEG